MIEQEQIAIIGLGLMGGSLGLALTRRGYRVSGWDQCREAVREAFNSGAINIITEDLGAAVAGAKVVFIATPVPCIANTIKTCLPLTTPGTIFSDLGSIKEHLTEQVFTFLPDGYYFVAGHPMTGSEQQGLAGADPFLFQNAAYILISDPRTPPNILEKIEALVQTTGCHVLRLPAAEHDRIVAMVSHLPHLIAATLAVSAGIAEEFHPGTLALAAGGFRDTTRVAMGSPELWEGIIRFNRQRVLDAINSFDQQLQKLQETLKQDQPGQLGDFLNSAREIRSQIPAKNKGFLTLLHEMVVTVEDRPGAIMEVLQILAGVGINIKDIEILRVREGDGGTVRLALEDEMAVERAVELLEHEGFKARKR